VNGLRKQSQFPCASFDLWWRNDVITTVPNLKPRSRVLPASISRAGEIVLGDHARVGAAQPDCRRLAGALPLAPAAAQSRLGRTVFPRSDRYARWARRGAGRAILPWSERRAYGPPLRVNYLLIRFAKALGGCLMAPGVPPSRRGVIAV